MTTDPFLVHLHSLLQYSHANRAVLKLRDQKQMDFEELSEYLSQVTAERDRLAAVISGRAGSTGLGLGAYIRDRVDSIRGADDDRSRVERMRKLDTKIKEVRVLVSISIYLHAQPPESLRSCKTLFKRHTRLRMRSAMKPFASRRSSRARRSPR